jgi:hypothetical protein
MSVNFSTNSSLAVNPFLTDDSGNVILARGTAANVPTGAGYAKGCLYLATDTGALYSNSGSTTAASFAIQATSVTSSTDKAIARYNGTAGALQNSLITIGDTGILITDASTSGTQFSFQAGSYLLGSSNGTGFVQSVFASKSFEFRNTSGTALASIAHDTGLIFPRQATTAGAPAYVKGAIYFDTTLNKLRVGGASAWETITSA